MKRVDKQVQPDFWPNVLKHGYAEQNVCPLFLEQHSKKIFAGMQRMSSHASDTDSFSSVTLGNDEAGWPTESGLTRRSDTEQKWFFHYFGRGTLVHLEKSGAPILNYAEFFNSLEAVSQRSIELVNSAIGLYESGCGQKLRRSTAPRCVMRVLRYLPIEQSGLPDARVHLDRSFLTVHWLSTQRGLVLFDPQRKKHTAREDDTGTVTLFPGKKFAALTNGVHGLGTPHGVKNPNRSIAEDRYALVAFVHLPLDDNDVVWLKENSWKMEALENECVI